MSMSAATARSAGGAGVGLVPYKTTQTILVSTSENAVADRRVRRLKRSVWASGHLHGLADVGKRSPVCWFVTLTYSKADAWEANHVRDAVSRFRNWCKSIGVACRYTWVAEIQPGRFLRTGKSVVHYHLLAWLPVGVSMPFWDKRLRGRKSSFWPHGMSNREVAFSGVGYLMKYLSKLGEYARFPDGLRLYGIGGLDRGARSVRSWFNLPQWAKAGFGVGELVRCANGLAVRATGELLAPVWKCLVIPGGLALTKLREFDDRFGLRNAEGLVVYPGAFSSFPRLV